MIECVFPLLDLAVRYEIDLVFPVDYEVAALVRARECLVTDLQACM